ncbi:MAG: aminoglycoside phosphotransferase family protein [Paracoccus sp. (in: a-proteobacteria)]|uniref:aminoglycoside phosphotransferase family protein n=1 Tax=Paracoccus sp. TaxID=267 RepID=UPI004058B4F6
MAAVLRDDPALAPTAYDRIVDLLADLHRHPVPSFIPALDGPALAEQVGLFALYPQALGTEAPRIGPIVAQLHAEWAADLPPVTALRDFHAKNLIWRGPAPLGLIDYQDAVTAHPAYDLVSALQDARRDVGPEVEEQAIGRYLSITGLDPDRFRAAYALLGAQRNLRIMGIFTRLAQRDRKLRYLDLMPRVWGHVQADLAHPALAPLARALRDVPGPDVHIRERIRAACRP